MAHFPLCIDLTRRKCVVVGGGAVATRKVAQLLQFEAAVTVISCENTPTLAQLAQDATIAYVNRAYQDGDLDGAFLTVAATADRDCNERVYNEAIQRGIWVNVVDQPQQCNFIFPSLVKRGPLVMGIHTSGKYPALSKQLRRRLETEVSGDIEANLALLESFRAKMQIQIADAAQRSAILNQMAQAALKLSKTELEAEMNRISKVWK